MSCRTRTGTLRMASIVFALMLLLGAGNAQAQVVLFDDLDEPDKATGIRDLTVPGFGTFDVEFKVQKTAETVFGDWPGDRVEIPPFGNKPDAQTAAEIMNAELREELALTIGEVGIPGLKDYNIPFYSFECCKIPILPDPEIPALVVIRTVNEGASDWFNTGENFLDWRTEEQEWAVFTPVPEPGATLSLLAALATLGAVARWRRKVSAGTA